MQLLQHFQPKRYAEMGMHVILRDNMGMKAKKSQISYSPLSREEMPRQGARTT